MDLIEAVQTPFSDKEALEQFEIGEVKIVRACDHGFPLTRRRQIGLGKAEVDVLVIGPDPKITLSDVDIVFDTLLARFDQRQFAGGIVGRNKAHLACLIVAAGNDEIVLLRAETRANTEALVLFEVKRHIACRWLANGVQLDFKAAPFLGRRRVNQARVIRDPGDPAAKVGEFIVKVFARLQILDPRGVTLRPVGVGRIGEIAPVPADAHCAKAEIFKTLGQFILVENKLRLGILGRTHGFAIMLPILGAFLELGPVEIVAVALGNGGIVLFDPCAHFGEERLGQILLPRHLRLEISILGLHIIEHVLVIDRGIGLVIEPVIGV